MGEAAAQHTRAELFPEPPSAPITNTLILPCFWKVMGAAVRSAVHSPTQLKPWCPTPVLLQVLMYFHEHSRDPHMVLRLQQPEDIRHHNKSLLS